MFEKLIDKEQPDFVCLEAVQFQHNFNTYLQLAQLQGVIFSSLFKNNIDFVIVESSKWRKFLGIKGRKREEYKQNCIDLINKKYGFECTDDEADAIAIGMWAIGNIKGVKGNEKNK